MRNRPKAAETVGVSIERCVLPFPMLTKLVWIAIAICPIALCVVIFLLKAFDTPKVHNKP
jgi:hypothetical protein